ncbi:hypothetical protein N9251_02565 [Gammaproteobacteria bacterium]|nr:hypothetical protein [Gammaproteobacteria bacterium]
MEQRDYLERQIDQIGLVLRAIVSKLMGMQIGSIATQGVEEANEKLVQELDIDFNTILLYPEDQVIDSLIQEKGFNFNNLEKLLEAFALIADDMDESDERRLLLYRRCVVIGAYLEENSQSVSFDRYLKMERFRKIIKV